MHLSHLSRAFKSFIRTPYLILRARSTRAVVLGNCALSPTFELGARRRKRLLRAMTAPGPSETPTSFYLRSKDTGENGEKCLILRPIVEGCKGKREKAPYPSTEGRRMQRKTGKEGRLEQEAEGRRVKERRKEKGKRN